MATGRMLKTRISKSKKMGHLSNDSARLLYLMILPHTDVEGRLEADPPLVRSVVMPYFKDWNDVKIQKALESLHSVGMIILYNVDQDQYLQIENFEKHQTLRKDREAESEIPTPTKLQPNSRQTPALSKDKLSKDKLSKDKLREGKKPLNNGEITVKPKDKKEANAVTTLRTYFCKQYTLKTGREYVINYGKEGKIFKDLLKFLTTEELKTLVNKFFALDDDWIEKAGYTIGVFKSQINKLQKKSGKEIYADFVKGRGKDESSEDYTINTPIG